MKRIVITTALIGALFLPSPAWALYPGEQGEPRSAVNAEQSSDTQSENMTLVANFNDDDTYRQGSDLAFWGNTMVAGNYNNPGGFRLLNISNPRNPREIGQFECYGPQSDVSIWRDLVFVSVDTPLTGPECGNRAAGATQYARGEAWEGIRVVSIKNPTKPKQIAAVDTDCGSHTHTLVPDVDNEAGPRLLIYVLSYPLGGQGVECNAVSHRKISVVEVPLDSPAKAEVISTPDVSPAIGCHDVTVHIEKQIAGAACISESQVWDLSNPAHPRVIAHIANPAINIHHSTTFSWDGRTLVLGDELGGAAASPGCPGPGQEPIGALWFYDVTQRTSPQVRGYFQIPQSVPDTVFCTAHNFNTVPVTDRDILVSAWYNGGNTVVDFTDPASPQQLAFSIPDDEDGRTATWSTYWYNGWAYANNFDEDVNSLTTKSRGIDVFSIDHERLDDAVDLPRLNPQTMEPLEPAHPGKGRGRPFV